MFGLFFVILGFFTTSPIPGMSNSAWVVAMTFIGIVWLWMAKGIGWPSLLCLLALAAVPEIGQKGVISSSFGNPIFPFLMFTFICCYALTKTNFLTNVARKLVNNKMSRNNFWGLNTAFGLAVMITGLIISPTVLFVMFLPILDSICEQTGIGKGEKRGEVLMTTLVVACGISSGMTTISHVFPTLALGVYEKAVGQTISNASYMFAAVPTGAMCFVAFLAIMWGLYKKQIYTDKLSVDEYVLERKEIDLLAEKWIVLIIGGLVILWTLPEAWNYVFAGTSIFKWAKMENYIPPLLASLCLFLLRVKNKPILTMEEAFKSGVPWTSLIMCSATLALGSAITNKDIGLIKWISDTAGAQLMGITGMTLVMILLFWAMLQTNFSSNMVTATTVSAIAITLCSGMTDVHLGALCALIGMSASFSFAAQSAMPCVALAGSSGWIDQKKMFFNGSIAALSSFAIITFIGYPLASMII